MFIICCFRLGASKLALDVVKLCEIGGSCCFANLKTVGWSLWLHTITLRLVSGSEDPLSRSMSVPSGVPG